MTVHHFIHDEGLVLYEDTEGDFEVDIPDELYDRWREARAVAFRAEEEICAIYAATLEPWLPPPPRPDPVLAVPTESVPVPRPVAEWLLAQEGA